MSSKKWKIFKTVNGTALNKLVSKAAPVYNWYVNAKASIGNEVLPAFGLEPLPDPITYYVDANGDLQPSKTMKVYAKELSQYGKRNKEVVDIAGKVANIPIDIPVDEINQVLEIIAPDGTKSLQLFKKVDGEWVKDGEPRQITADGTLPVNSGAEYTKYIFGAAALYLIYKILK